MDEKELSGFLARLNNVADEPKASRPRAARPYPAAVNPTPSADNAAAKPDGWGGRAPAPSERASSPTSNENLAYLNALTSIRVVFKDGREVVTTIQKVDEVIEDERESRRRASRRVGA